MKDNFCITNEYSIIRKGKFYNRDCLCHAVDPAGVDGTYLSELFCT